MRRICAWPGCAEPAATHRRTNDGSQDLAYCDRHLRLGYGATHGNGSHRQGSRRLLSPEQEAEIARRIRRFESPKALAREFGVTTSTIRAIVARRTS
jgi:hypothetical protein